MPRKPKNLDLPGMSDRRIPEIHEAALVYVGYRDERMDLNKKEIAAKEELKAIMHRMNMKAYVFEGVEVTLEPIPADEELKVKVAKSKAPGGTPDDPGISEAEFDAHLTAQENFSASEGEPVSPQDGADFDLMTESEIDKLGEE